MFPHPVALSNTETHTHTQTKTHAAIFISMTSFMFDIPVDLPNVGNYFIFICERSPKFQIVQDTLRRKSNFSIYIFFYSHCQSTQ